MPVHFSYVQAVIGSSLAILSFIFSTRIVMLTAKPDQYADSEVIDYIENIRPNPLKKLLFWMSLCDAFFSIHYVKFVTLHFVILFFFFVVWTLFFCQSHFWQLYFFCQLHQRSSFQITPPPFLFAKIRRRVIWKELPWYFLPTP